MQQSQLKPILAFTFLLSACQADVYTTDIKEYYFTVEPRSEQNTQLFSVFFRKFNRQLAQHLGARQMRFLQLTTSKTSDTSSIYVGDKSQYRRVELDGQEYQSVGKGRWERKSHIYSYGGLLLRRQKIIKNIYRMKLYFNSEYLYEWHNSNDYLTRQRAYTLFLHELGHGMLMQHHPDPDDVMYYRIDSARKDIPSFMARVVKFLQR
ncbi:MAG: hypothetical protein OYH77_05740 [Pseudomonadota bacterium]|nr:hypothetical protein [Pseudomonadota bacterium]